MDSKALYRGFYAGKKILVTGHGGFKGSWLTYMLWMLGAGVVGKSRHLRQHYTMLRATEEMPEALNGESPIDIKRGPWHTSASMIGPVSMQKIFDEHSPEVVFHLAANAIVKTSFDQPFETFDSNIGGVLHLLEECRKATNQPKAIVIITTDKVYQNQHWDSWGYRENDQLGDTTPYGASKVCVEHIVNCYREHFLPQIAVARAGNVIGGGDWAEGRLIPDIVRATIAGGVVDIATPNATRPWQHVLEAVNGYLLLGQKLAEDPERYNKAYNFGPVGEMTVEQVVRTAADVWGKIKYEFSYREVHPSMVELLKIDSSRAEKDLGWSPRWPMRVAVRRAILWYKAWYEKQALRTGRDCDTFYNVNI